MIKRSLFLSLFLSILFVPNLLKSQNTIKGVVLDKDTKMPIACAQVWISSWENDLDTVVSTDKKGSFVVEGLSVSEFNLSISKDNYKSYEHYYENIPSTLEISMYSYDSESYKIEDIAKEDNFDFTFGFDLYSPALADSDDKFKSVFSFDYAYEGKVKLANRVQLGFRYTPLKMKWMAMNSDTTLVNIAHGKERYFEASTSIGLYTRFIITTAGNEGHRGLFLDLGASYSLPYYFSYTYFTADHIKTSQNKIHKFNDFQAMVRLGFYWGSIRANYRFTDVMKDNFVESPKLTLGVEFNIPMGN